MILTGIFSAFLLLTSLVYLTVIFRARAGLKRISGTPPVRTGETIRITVIIPARNEETAIRDCLSDMVRQDYPRHLFEVIVADDHSTDSTADVVRKISEEFPGFSLRTITGVPDDEGKGSPKKRMITLAVETASGELVLLTDADTRRGPGWIGSFAAFYNTFRPKMILGPVAMTRGDRFFTRLQSLEFAGLMGITAGSAGLGHPLMCNGANLGFVRTAFMEAGGYRTNDRIASGDDLFLMIRFREQFGKESVRFTFSREAIVHTFPESRFTGFIRQRIRWASKNRFLTDRYILFVAVVTWLMNASLLSGIAAGLFFPWLLIPVSSLLLIKMAAEYPVVSRMMRFSGEQARAGLFVAGQLLNIPYVVLAGILGMFASYEWKGRRVSRPVSGA